MSDNSLSLALMGEALLNHRLLLERPGRQFVEVAGSRWGELISPASDEARVTRGEGLRLVLFASFEFGYLALQAIKAYALHFPNRVQIVALVTDDPVDPTALIGLKKRIWKYLDREEQFALETAIAESALTAGIPVYTGEVKIEEFRKLLDTWQPDAIVSCVFGQVIDRWIIDRPAYGIYNFHPSDLAHGHGSGLAPDVDLTARGATSTVWSIHQMAEAVDAGRVISSSPSVNVSDANGLLPDNHLLIYDKLLEPVGCLATCLVSELSARYQAGLTGKIESMEVAFSIPAEMQDWMLTPICTDRHDDRLPTFDSSLLAAFM
jgi:folate-dependent phosphoribosylglycinamide formyltransferase PurN